MGQEGVSEVGERGGDRGVYWGGNKIIEIEGRSSEQEIQEKIVNMQAKEISL